MLFMQGIFLHSPPNSLFRKCGKWKLLIKDLPTLWLPRAVCRHLEPAASCPLKRKEKTYWSVDGRAALYDKSPTLAHQQEKSSLHLKMYLLIRVTERSLFDVCYFSTCKHLCWSVEEPRANSQNNMSIPPNTNPEPYSKFRMWLSASRDIKDNYKMTVSATDEHKWNHFFSPSMLL